MVAAWSGQSQPSFVAPSVHVGFSLRLCVTIIFFVFLCTVCGLQSPCLMWFYLIVETFEFRVGYSLTIDYVLISAMHPSLQSPLGGGCSFYQAGIWVGLKGLPRVMPMSTSSFLGEVQVRLKGLVKTMPLLIWVELKGLLRVEPLPASPSLGFCVGLKGLTRVMPISSYVLVHVPKGGRAGFTCFLQPTPQWTGLKIKIHNPHSEWSTRWALGSTDRDGFMRV
jgi:hypothetical protein